MARVEYSCTEKEVKSLSQLPLSSFKYFSFYISEVPAVPEEEDQHKALTWSLPFPLTQSNVLESSQR